MTTASELKARIDQEFKDLDLIFKKKDRTPRENEIFAIGIKEIDRLLTQLEQKQDIGNLKLDLMKLKQWKVKQI